MLRCLMSPGEHGACACTCNTTFRLSPPWHGTRQGFMDGTSCMLHSSPLLNQQPFRALVTGLKTFLVTIRNNICAMSYVKYLLRMNQATPSSYTWSPSLFYLIHASALPRGLTYLPSYHRSLSCLHLRHLTASLFHFTSAHLILSETGSPAA